MARLTFLALLLLAYCIALVENFAVDGLYTTRAARLASIERRGSLLRRLPALSARQWDGDDIRWTQKLRRRFRGRSITRMTAKKALILLNLAAFLYQVISSVDHVRRKHPLYWPSDAILMIWDVLIGAAIFGPFTMDFLHSPLYSKRQPHRYLTAGFLHSGLIHLLVNLESLLRTPSWLETGLGWPLFVTAYLVSVVTGNACHSLTTLDNSIILGASGGICGLYGLMFVALIKMGNARLGAQVLSNMALIFLYGLVLSNVSNAAHIGGFLGGIAMGILCCPTYRKSYSLTRKNSLEADLADRDYRLAMGYGKIPSRRGLIPIALVWVPAIVALVLNPLYRRIPLQVFQGLVHPGSLSSLRTSL